jgi:hypothetical protein
MRRARILSASVRASASHSSRLGDDGVGEGGSRRARVSCHPAVGTGVQQTMCRRDDDSRRNSGAGPTPWSAYL